MKKIWFLKKILKKIRFSNWKFDLTHKKQLDFKNFWKSQSKFSNLKREKGKDIFFIFEFFMMREKNTKNTQYMKIWDQNTWCMQEHYECQDEHQEHFECQDEHQELIFEKFLRKEKHARHQT